MFFLKGFDGETKDLLGVEAFEGEKFLDIKGVIAKLKAKRVLFSYVKAWSSIDRSCANKVWGKGQNRPKSRDERLNEHVEQPYCEYGYESKSS